MFQDVLIISGPEKPWACGVGQEHCSLSPNMWGWGWGGECISQFEGPSKGDYKQHGHDPALKDYGLACCASHTLICPWMIGGSGSSANSGSVGPERGLSFSVSNHLPDGSEAACPGTIL